MIRVKHLYISLQFVTHHLNCKMNYLTVLQRFFEEMLNNNTTAGPDTNNIHFTILKLFNLNINCSYLGREG